jgi:hypothetical protein
MKLAVVLSAFALTGLAACSTYYEPAPGAVTSTGGSPVLSPGSTASTTTATPAPASQISAYRPGFGIVESISLVTLPASASAGGSLPAVSGGPYRMTLRMDDGTIQTVISDTRAVLVGDRVQIMPDGRLVRP